MTLDELLRLATEAGLKLRSDGVRLHVGGQYQQHAALVAQLSAHKADVVAALGRKCACGDVALSIWTADGIARCERCFYRHKANWERLDPATRGYWWSDCSVCGEPGAGQHWAHPTGSEALCCDCFMVESGRDEVAS